jgi:hypothetical protein
MVLSDVEETVTIVEVEEDNVDLAVRVSSPFVPQKRRAERGTLSCIWFVFSSFLVRFH